jgi:hypothetical protein
MGPASTITVSSNWCSAPSPPPKPNVSPQNKASCAYQLPDVVCTEMTTSTTAGYDNMTTLAYDNVPTSAHKQWEHECSPHTKIAPLATPEEMIASMEGQIHTSKTHDNDKLKDRKKEINDTTQVSKQLPSVELSLSQLDTLLQNALVC